MNNTTINAQIGIIGAGISGLTAAYQLARKGYSSITVLEAADRVGGKCFSITYKGKTYEMGALIGLPSYKHTLEFMDELNLKDEGPLLERGFFDLYGKRIPQIPLDQVEAFNEEFKRLPNILSQYECLSVCGFHLPADLCQSFASWCKQNALEVIQQIFMHYFSAFGFGNIHEVPAAYVLKFLNYDNLMSFIEITHMISWPKGVGELAKRMADHIQDLRLTSKVQSIKLQTDGKLRVETDQDIFYFDKVIYTAPLPNLTHLIDLPPSERDLFQLIQYENFRVYAYRVDGLPKVSGYIPCNMQIERKGHMMAWYYRWPDLDETDLITLYVMENELMSDYQMREVIEDKLRKLGGENIKLYMMKRWQRFPHVDSKSLREGFYERLEGMQGKYNLYYAGEIMNFSTIEGCIAYAKSLVDRYF